MQVYLERNGNGKTPFKIQVKKQAPKPKQKSRPRSADRSRGFQARRQPLSLQPGCLLSSRRHGYLVSACCSCRDCNSPPATLGFAGG